MFGACKCQFVCPRGSFSPVRFLMTQRGYRLQHSPFQKSFLIPVIQKTQGDSWNCTRYKGPHLASLSPVPAIAWPCQG